MPDTHSDTSVANTAGGEPILAPDPADPVARLEKAALEIALQHPHLMSVSQWQEFARVEFRYRMHRENFSRHHTRGLHGSTRCRG